jgi:hypothetical protein
MDSGFSLNNSLRKNLSARGFGVLGEERYRRFFAFLRCTKNFANLPSRYIQTLSRVR